MILVALYIWNVPAQSGTLFDPAYLDFARLARPTPSPGLPESSARTNTGLGLKLSTIYGRRRCRVGVFG
jgi:hypothetical protein